MNKVMRALAWLLFVLLAALASYCFSWLAGMADWRFLPGARIASHFYPNVGDWLGDSSGWTLAFHINAGFCFTLTCLVTFFGRRRLRRLEPEHLGWAETARTAGILVFAAISSAALAMTMEAIFQRNELVEQNFWGLTLLWFILISTSAVFVHERNRKRKPRSGVSRGDL